MYSVIETSQEQYLKTKENVLQGRVTTKIEMDISSLDFLDLKNIKIEGRSVKFTQNAIKGLLKLLGINNAFYTNVKKYDTDNHLFNQIIGRIKSMKNNRVVVVFNSREQKIVDIYLKKDKAITDHQYFETLEKLLRQNEGSRLRTLTAKRDGSLEAIIAKPSEFQYGGLNDEIFTMGMTLNLNSTGLSSSFFCERLACKLCARCKF